jgi:hypothetical protein
MLAQVQVVLKALWTGPQESVLSKVRLQLGYATTSSGLRLAGQAAPQLESLQSHAIALTMMHLSPQQRRRTHLQPPQ